MKILSLKKSAPRPPREVYRTKRMEFRQWLIYELSLRGANLPERPSYKQIQEACVRYLVPR